MKAIYLDLSMGAAGDMLTAALLDLHEDSEQVLETLNRIFAGKAVLSCRRDQKCGIIGSHVTVSIDGEVEGESHQREPLAQSHAEDRNLPHGLHHHTSITEVRAFISGLQLPADVVRDALAVYDLIAEAEARVHGHRMENIHFHEVGSLDAMADVVSVCWLMHELGVEKVFASPVHVGSGTVHCAHGELPVPAPATQELLKGIPIYSADVRGELCTPTGAALLRHFVSDFGGMPLMRVSRISYGTGFRDFPQPNVIRALLGEVDSSPDQVIELVCNIDDMTAEELAFAQERLFDAGALDVYFTNIGMKKSRPAVMLTCMCRAGQRQEMLACLFRHTASLGIREYVCNRYTLRRELYTKESSCGTVRVKRASGYGVEREKPEFEDLKKIAKEQNLSLREVRELLSRECP